MTVEADIEKGIYDKLSDLLSKADSYDKASGFVSSYLQSKIAEGVIDLFDYKILDMGANGYHAEVEFMFSWSLNKFCSMLVIPSSNHIKAFDRAMGVI